jgi:hypothetical protein
MQFTGRGGWGGVEASIGSLPPRSGTASRFGVWFHVRVGIVVAYEVQKNALFKERFAV